MAIGLVMSKLQLSVGHSLTLMEEAGRSYYEVELVLIPIIFNAISI